MEIWDKINKENGEQHKKRKKPLPSRCGRAGERVRDYGMRSPPMKNAVTTPGPVCEPMTVPM